MPEYRHPRTLDSVAGNVPPAQVTLGGERVPVDGDTFEAEESAVRPLAAAYDLRVSELRVDDSDDGEDNEYRCGVNGCSRTVESANAVCWQHEDE